MKFDKRTIVGLLVGAVVGATTVFATVHAQNAEEKEFSREHLKYTYDVIKQLQVLNSFDQLLPTMANRTRTLFVRNNPALAEEIEAAVNSAALQLVEKRNDLDDLVLKIWANRFTTEEIMKISEFFASPAGQAFARLSGELLQESAVAAKVWSDERSVEIVDLVREDLRRRGAIE